MLQMSAHLFPIFIKKKVDEIYVTMLCERRTLFSTKSLALQLSIVLRH